MSYEMIGELSVSTEDKVLLPDDSLIVLADSGVYPTWNLHGDLHFCNHNIFRLDKDGNVIWQVQRDDKGAINWERIMAEVAKGDKGDPETSRKARDPFMMLYPYFFEQGAYRSDLADPWTGVKERTTTWRKGLVLLTWASFPYELDIKTGMATNVQRGKSRPW